MFNLTHPVLYLLPSAYTIVLQRISPETDVAQDGERQQPTDCSSPPRWRLRVGHYSCLYLSNDICGSYYANVWPYFWLKIPRVWNITYRTNFHFCLVSPDLEHHHLVCRTPGAAKEWEICWIMWDYDVHHWIGALRLFYQHSWYDAGLWAGSWGGDWPVQC